MSIINTRKTLFNSNWLILYLILMFIVAGAGWFATGYLGDKARQEILEYNDSRISLHSSHLIAEFEKINRAVKLLSGSPWIASALISSKDQDIANANSALDRYNSNMESSVSYLMDGNGMTIASSNRNDSDSFVGKSYQFRPYFTQAIKGAPGRYFALGATSLKRGFYASYPVVDSNGVIIGVAVIKQDVDTEEAHFVKNPYCFVVDPNGIIFLSGKKEMNFKSMWPVSRETQLALLKSKQFGGKEFKAVLPREVTDGTEVTFDGRNYIASRKVFNPEGWSIVLMTTTERVLMHKSAGVIITILICTFMIVPLIINYRTLRSAEILRESEKRFSELFNTISSGVAIYHEKNNGEDFIITGINPAGERINRVKKQDIVGKSITEVFPGVKELGLFDVMKEVWKTGEHKYHPVSLYSDRRISLWVENNVYKLASGDIVAVHDDVTERRQAEEALLESEKKYRNILENIEDGYYEVDTAGNFTFFNYSLCRILGYSADELMGKNNREYADDKNAKKIFKVFNEVYRTGLPTKAFDWELIKKDGSKCFAEMVVSLITDSNNVKTGFRGIARDVTERKRAEEELDNSFKRLRAALGGTIQALAIASETRDPYTAGHQKRVADLSRAIATKMGLDSNQTDGIRMAGVIHDLGKMAVPAEILSKPSKLSAIEYNLIKTHPRAGYDILKDVEFPWPIAQIVLQHHERLDGSGYPAGLKGDEILMEARVIAVADVVEAIASYRPYRPALGMEKALGEITQNKGILYDPAVVDACLCLFRDRGYKFE
jgi:PAS domain S-box-containing protein